MACSRCALFCCAACIYPCTHAQGDKGDKDKKKRGGGKRDKDAAGKGKGKDAAGAEAKADGAADRPSGSGKQQMTFGDYWKKTGGVGNQFLRSALGGHGCDGEEDEWEFTDVAVRL